MVNLHQLFHGIPVVLFFLQALSFTNELLKKVRLQIHHGHRIISKCHPNYIVHFSNSVSIVFESYISLEIWN